MRLEKIKLAGFKSFVDPTTVPFPNNLCGVVGPNGCGKSNVIDAVRWVMGESSAKMLRGESMADVIFNGSTSRKPVGTASIELTFDNSEGRAGGQFAAFNTIAVKRQVSRDGQSVYSLNGSRCRRRDIQDLFLGTGLGPRSYAIIEQGMISRFIEAKPEELRQFIEEAAGISKYKERRRETENRMRHTRENLERLQDLRDEVGKQLLHLERQAATAEKYRAYKADEERLALELSALRWRQLDQTIQQQDRQISEQEVELERQRAEQRAAEAEIEAGRDAHASASQEFNEAQGHYYAVGSEIARLEQAIQHAREIRENRERELNRLDQELAQAEDHHRRDQTRLAELDQTLIAEEPVLAAMETASAQANQAAKDAEQRLDAWQAQWDDLQTSIAQPTEIAQAARGRINNLEQRLTLDEQRLEKVDAERDKLDCSALENSIGPLEARAEALDRRSTEVSEAHRQITETLGTLDEEIRHLGARLDQLRTELQHCRGRQSSLQALQEAARDPGSNTRDWIERQGLTEAPRLLDLLEVEPGWELATETVLDQALAGLCIAQLDSHADQLETGPLTLLEQHSEFDNQHPTTSGPRLIDRLRCPWSLHGLLAEVRVADSLSEALTQRSELTTGERIVTRDGYLLGRNWISSPGDKTGTQGSLERAEALRALEQEIARLEADIQILNQQLQTQSAQRQTQETERAEAQHGINQLGRERAALDSELNGARQRLNHLQERQQRLDEEREALIETRVRLKAEIEDDRVDLNQALAEIDRLSETRESLFAERDQLREALTQARQDQARQRDELQRLNLSIRTARASRDLVQSALERAEQQRMGLHERRETLLEDMARDGDPLADQRQALDAQLALRLQAETGLTQTRNRMESLDQEVRAAEQRRQRLEQAVAGLQQQLDQLRLARQEQLVLRRTQEEELDGHQRDPRDILEQLSETTDAQTKATELEQIRTRIQRLGNINLAAIDEYQEQAERMQYLEQQHADILASLETLESAIRKIDRETRSRFKETFDQVNGGLQQLFPRVFGGGHAYLELTGEDLLDTGITVMARPPGKRNASIHLLSGGEKALTAVALVFAIFQLNPAPFCMLDEVDAPLDDANVSRFCDLVRSMSDQVQFIFITHNKVTMEIADHLIGVTMHEPGVSRLVSVDVEEAARMAAAS